ncbi:fin bud initiation factor a [Danio rerio]|uniref:Fin bud initiation factor a n=2 Tax=Danio rerio TaxID=7955 RepID=A0AB12ZRE6_DANRE|nr:fin bud initiation factor a [Danio rerio]|eukprot:XP_002667824.1 fin bud initiation factor-like [Danio rerio]
MWTSPLSGRSDLRRGQKRSIMLPFALGLFLLPLCGAVYEGPLLPEMSNGTFHHFFVPDGDYEETEDPEKCQMLFKWIDRRPCPLEEDRDTVIREDFVIVKQQIEDAARVLETLGKSISFDLDGEDSYGKYLKREIEQIGEAFTNVEKSLLELESKFKQSQETEQREESEFSSNFIKPVYDVRETLQETLDISSGLKDKHELISLIVRNHGSRLSRLKNDYLNV